jgi:hypothetical protein
MALDANFWPALWNLAIASGTRPEIFLTVWFAESGLDPTAENRDGCIGLNQTCPKEWGGPAFPSTPQAYQAAPASEQVAWITPQVLAANKLNGGPFLSAARAYQANLMPATLTTARGSGDVIMSKFGPHPMEYAANEALDVNRDGKITLQDLGDYLVRVVSERGYDVDLGAPLSVAIHTAYTHRPANAPWTSPSLVIREPASAVARRSRSAGVLGALLLGAVLAGAASRRSTA